MNADTGQGRSRTVRRRRLAGAVGIAVVAGAVAWSVAVRPSHDRDWQPEHARAPHAVVTGDAVRIHDIRDFRYDAAGRAIASYYTRDYDLSALESVWFVLTPFERDFRGPAHAFLSFGFADSQYVAISVEARREVSESYSMLRGMLKRYELLYVIGDERDLIGNRALVQDDEVYVYPIRANAAQVRALFEDMLDRANALHRAPEFYGTLLNNCTTAILEHVNRIAERKIRWGPRILLPGYSDALALELGLIDTELDIEGARARYRINDLARAAADDSRFGVAIRSGR